MTRHRGRPRGFELPALAAGVVAVAGAALAVAILSAPDAPSNTEQITALRPQSPATLDHAHDDSAAESGHQHILGPAEEVPVSDRVQRKLDRQLAAARRSVAGIRTAADAMARGYQIATVDLPFLGVHYLKPEYLSLPFDPARPTHVIFGTDDPDASLVGLMYYVEHDGVPEGFAGPNDHWHRHLKACLSGGIMIALDDISDEECSAMGGEMTDLGPEYERRWMVHVWVVPGMENPWGIFADGSPLLA